MNINIIIYNKNFMFLLKQIYKITLNNFKNNFFGLI